MQWRTQISDPCTDSAIGMLQALPYPCKTQIRAHEASHEDRECQKGNRPNTGKSGNDDDQHHQIEPQQERVNPEIK